jgi:hypothetical protein
MKILFNAEECNVSSRRVQGEYLLLTDLEKECVLADKDFDEAILVCDGKNSDGSCGLTSIRPCLRTVIDECLDEKPSLDEEIL